MKINLHTHSTFSDGKLTPAEIVRAAIDAGLSHVAITDHFASSKLHTKGVTHQTLPGYAAQIKELAAKQTGKIKVLAGIEMDFSPKRTDFSVFNAPSPEESVFRHLDFVLFEYVGDPEWEGGGLEDFVRVRPKVPLPVGLAHCHFERNFSGLMPQTVIAILGRNKIFVELCPSERNSSLLFTGPPEEHSKVLHELQALHRQMEPLSKQLAESPGDEYLLKLHAEFQEEMNQHYARFKRMPAYRMTSRFTREFFNRLPGTHVLLSIGTDSHDSAEEVGQIGDAVDFIEKQMLQHNVITNFFWNS